MLMGRTKSTSPFVPISKSIYALLILLPKRFVRVESHHGMCTYVAHGIIPRVETLINLVFQWVHNSDYEPYVLLLKPRLKKGLQITWIKKLTANNRSSTSCAVFPADRTQEVANTYRFEP
jgi:hypothetical protein